MLKFDNQGCFFLSLIIQFYYTISSLFPLLNRKTEVKLENALSYRKSFFFLAQNDNNIQWGIVENYCSLVKSCLSQNLQF